MVIALFALSLVMIVGGAAAVVQGFPYVRLESGLAMVIGGTTAASAGAVLLGIAVAMLQMKKLVEALGRRGSGAAYAAASAPDEPIPSAAGLRGPIFEEPAPIAPEPAAATASAAGLAGISLGGMRDLLGTGDSRPALDPPSHREAQPELPLPNLPPPAVPEPIAPTAPGEPILADEDLFASPNDRPGHGPRAAADKPLDEATEADPAQEELALRPALEGPETAADVASPASDTPTAASEEAVAEETKPKPEDLQVVGTYASGANTYVMFANGTIQADTPRGQFTFQSLDELKEFVDTGGEANARGAA